MFPDVPDRLPTCVCVKCRLPIKDKHAVVQVLSAAGIGPGPGTGRTVHINEIAEAAHLDCARPAITLSADAIPRTKLKPGDPPHVPQMSPDYQCVRCGKVYGRADRFIQVYRAEGIAVDPETKAPALRCSDGYETSHLDCSDPQLKGEGSLVLVGTA